MMPKMPCARHTCRESPCNVHAAVVGMNDGYVPILYVADQGRDAAQDTQAGCNSTRDQIGRQNGSFPKINDVERNFLFVQQESKRSSPVLQDDQRCEAT